VRIALIQMKVVYGEPQTNLKAAGAKIREACEHDPDILVLPEMWNAGYALTDIADTADKNGSPCAQTVAGWAREYAVNIVGGSVADRRDGKTYNTSYIFDKNGSEAAVYSKTHLFGLMDEGSYLTPGTERAQFMLDGVKCGVIICYDLRFPELSRALALEGIKILFVPAQWPRPRMHPWRTLLQARAIENQFFVAGVNCVGPAGGADFFGHSLVVGPQGEILAEGSDEEEIIYVDIDLEQVEKTRKWMDCFGDRVPQVY